MRKIHNSRPILLHYFCTMIVGLISDTHGLLRPEALSALEGVDVILHAGDVGAPEVLIGLEAIAPVEAVHGNIDPRDAWPHTLRFSFGGVQILMLHDLSHLTPAMLATQPTLVVYGHSHMPALYLQAGIHYLNPGAAGKKRFSLPISVARLHIDGAKWRVEFLNLLDERPLP
jgi:uncharacterized protein